MALTEIDPFQRKSLFGQYCLRTTFYKEKQVYDFLLASLKNSPSKFGVSLEGKNLLLKGANSFLKEKLHIKPGITSFWQELLPLEMCLFTLNMFIQQAHYNCLFWVVLLVVISVIVIFVEADGYSKVCCFYTLLL